MNPFPQKNFISFVLIILLSLLGGIIGGLFGTGGGIVLVFLFSRIYKETPSLDRKDIFAMTVLSVAIMSLSSLFLYIKKDAVTFSDSLPTLFPAMLGGLFGAWLLDKINTLWLNRIFAIFIICAGATLLFR